MNLPENQNRLMDALIKTGTPIVAVLSTGGAVLLPWREQVDSILLMYLGGQNSGSAVADLLFGDANPCGKLAETWPLALEDTPCHGFFGNGGNVEYRESIYVGYRYYDKAKKEVVQLYVAPPVNGMFRPVRELRAFAKVELAPGESKVVELSLDRRAFAYYDIQAKNWRVDGGTYAVEAGSSSRDIRLTQTIEVQGTTPIITLNGRVPNYCDPAKQWPVPKEQFECLLGHSVPPARSLRPFTTNSTLGEIQTTFVGRIFVKLIKANMAKTMGGEGMEELSKMIDAMLEDMPLRQLAMMSGGAMTPAMMDGLVEMTNGHLFLGLKKMRA